MAVAEAAADVDPAALAYIRHLVEVFRTTSFEEACYDQNDKENDADLFQHRPEPSAVPADVARALDTIEEILWKGSPTLAADERLDIRHQRALQEETVGAVEATVRSVEEQIAGRHGTVDAKKRRLPAVRDAMAEDRDRLAALMTTAPAADSEAEASVAIMSLLERLHRAEEEEAALAMAVESFAGLLEQLEDFKARLEEEKAKLEAIPKLYGGGREDDVAVFLAAGSFNKSVRVLRRFIAQCDA